MLDLAPIKRRLATYESDWTQAGMAHALVGDVPALVAEVERLRAVGKKIAGVLSTWDHGEDCPKAGHNECCEDEAEPEGWYCEQGETQPDCTRLDCDCTKDRSDKLAAQLAGDLPAPAAT